MAQARRRPNRPRKSGNDQSGGSPQAIPPEPCRDSERSAEVVLLFPTGEEIPALRSLHDLIGARPVARSGDSTDGALAIGELSSAETVVFSKLGIALFQAYPDQVRRLRERTVDGNTEDSAIFINDVVGSGIEQPILHEHTSQKPSAPPIYLRGYRDAVNDLCQTFGVAETGRDDSNDVGSLSDEYRDDARGTWGLHATGVLNSAFTGRGVRVAALVDGLDLMHPDWRGRRVVAKSFVAGESIDGSSSGTHYLGTALGTLRPSQGPRYGCAPNALPYAAKVLSRTGSGTTSTILAGIEWATASGCRVILAPLGGGGLPTPIYEAIARRVLASGGVIVAGAGNSARRSQGDFGTIANPAATPSIIAVGSSDPRQLVASFSPRSTAAKAIDLIAPGVNLRSSLASSYVTWSGSSTAASCVAGIAALWLEADPAAVGKDLRRTLVAHARVLPLPAADVGAGLVQAP